MLDQRCVKCTKCGLCMVIECFEDTYMVWEESCLYKNGSAPLYVNGEQYESFICWCCCETILCCLNGCSLFMWTVGKVKWDKKMGVWVQSQKWKIQNSLAMGPFLDYARVVRKWINPTEKYVGILQDILKRKLKINVDRNKVMVLEQAVEFKVWSCKFIQD